MQKLRLIYKFSLIVVMLLLLLVLDLSAGKFELTFISDSLQSAFLSENSKADSTVLELKDKINSDIIFYESKNLNLDTSSTSGYYFFSPEIFSSGADSINQYNLNKRIIASNVKIINDSLSIAVYDKKIFEIDDSTRIGLFGIVTPDFSILYPDKANNCAFRLDILECTKEVIDEFKQDSVNIILAFNFLDEYLNYQLLKNNSELNFIFDIFTKGTKDYSERAILKERLKNLYFSDFLLKKFTFYYSHKPSFVIDSLKISKN